MVFRYAGGIPRLINVLCDTAMLCAFAEERTVVDDGLVKAAAQELQWVEFAERLREQDLAEATGEFAPSGSLRFARIEVLFRDQFVADYTLPAGRAIIGRTPDNDLQIRSKFVSRHHAQIVSDGAQSVVEDLNSTNGVFIKSQRVKRHELVDGDVIQLGEHKLLYRDLRRTHIVAHHHHDEEDTDDDEDDDDADELDDEETDGERDGVDKEAERASSK
jgi:general secretion pathway protein A